MIGEVKTREDEQGNVALFQRRAAGSVVAPRRRFSKAELDAIIKITTGAWRSAPPIVPVNDFAALPPKLQQDAFEQGSDGSDIVAAWHEGTACLVRSHKSLWTRRGVEEALFHEIWGHYGLRALFGKDTRRALTRMAKAMGGTPGIRRYARGELPNQDTLVSDSAHPARQASEFLNAHGIPGLRYLDGDSRSKGEGTHNYVIWDENLLTPEKAQIQTYFQRKPGGEANPKWHRTVEKLANGVRARWNADTRPKLRVFASPAEFAEAFPQVARDNPRYVHAHGFYDGQGVYLIASNLKTKAEVLKTLAHEAIGHYGVERVVHAAYGAGAWDKIVASILRLEREGRGGARMQAVLKEVRVRYGHKISDKLFAEETLAVMAEKGVRNGLLDRVVTAIRRFLRQIMPDLKLSRHELAQLLVRSERYLREGETYQQRVAMRRALAFSQADPVQSDNFKRWFGDWTLPGNSPTSRVVDAAGRPKVVHHGTADGFYTFDDQRLGSNTSHMTTPLGHFFAEDRTKAQRYAENASQGVPADERVIDAYLNIRKPKSMRVSDFLKVESQAEARALRAKLESEGYDGIHMPEVGQWIAFKNNQIKSASENTGEFSAENPDIRFAQGEPDDKVQVTNIPGGKFGSVVTRKARRIARIGAFKYLEGLRRRGIQITNQQTDWKIGFTNRGNRELNAWSAKPEDVEALAAVAPLLRRAVLGDSQENRKAVKGDSVRAYHFFYAPLKIGTETRIARLAVREDVNGNFAYDLQQSHVLEKGNPEQVPRAPAAKAGAWTPESGSNPTIAQLRDVVNATEDPRWSYRPDNELPDAARPRFSLPSDEDKVHTDPGGVVDTLKRVTTDPGDGLLARLKGKVEDWRPHWLNGLTLDQLAELTEKYLPEVKRFARSVDDMEAFRNELLTEAGVEADKIKRWARKNSQEADDLFNLAHDATIAGTDPAEPYRELTIDVGREKLAANRKNVKHAIEVVREQMLGRSGDDKRNMMDKIKDLRGMPAREKARKAAYPDLVERWNRLTPEAKEHYKAMRDMYEKRSQQLEEALLEHIDNMDEGDSKTKEAWKAKIRYQFESARVEAPYFPLVRFGKFWVSASKNGEKIFRMYETSREWKQDMKKLRRGGWKVEAKGRKAEQAKASQAASTGFVSEVLQMLNKEGVSTHVQDEVYQMFLQTLPDLSMRKSFIHRKKTVGYSKDALRAFGRNMFHGGHQIARLKYTWQIERHMLNADKRLEEMRKAADEQTIAAADAARENLEKRFEWIMNPRDSKGTNVSSSVGFIYYLGLTPAAAMVNMTQTAITTFPALAARHGIGPAFKMLSRAMADTIKTGGNIRKTLSSDEERAAFDEMDKSGLFERTVAHNLAGIAEGSGIQLNPAWEKTMEVTSFLFHKAEVLNREASAMAAYRLARAKGESPEEAIQYARSIVKRTHFNYSNANRAPFMQSGTAKVLLMFRQYSQQMSWYMIRNAHQALHGQTRKVRQEALKTLTGVLVMTAMFAGTMGLPLVKMIFGALNAGYGLWGDDDEPWDAETAFRNFLADMLGKKAAQVVATGPINALTGADIASRVSLSDLWFRDADRELEGRDAYYNLLETIAGPVGGIGKNLYVAKKLMNEGQWERGVETLLPKALKDGMKGLRYAREGVNNLRGEPLIDDVSPYQAALRLVGFSPAEVSERYEGNNAARNFEAAIAKRRGRLLDMFAMATRMGDAVGRRKTLRQIREFNRSNPDWPISVDTIRRSLRAKARRTSRSDHGMVLNRHLAARSRERARFVGD